MPDSTENANIYKALSTPARRRLLELIELNGPIELKGLTSKAEMKETTLRHHLLVLERAGLVSSEEGHGGTPGRPPMVYSIPPKHWQLGFPKRQYALLAEKLLTLLVEKDGVAAAKEAMRAIGAESARHILEAAAEAKGSDEFEVADFEKYVIPALNGFGSATRILEASEERVSVRMNNCIFYELAQVYPKLVCEGHAALYEELGAAFGGLSYVKGECLAGGDAFCRSDLVRNGDENPPE